MSDGKWVQIFKCIISHSSTNTWFHYYLNSPSETSTYLFHFFGKLNSLKSAMYLLTCQYFGMEKKIVLSESRVAFCRLFIVWIKKGMLWKESLRGTSRMFFSLYTGVSLPICTTSFGLMALMNKVECQCYNKTNIPPC